LVLADLVHTRPNFSIDSLKSSWLVWLMWFLSLRNDWEQLEVFHSGPTPGLAGDV
jgi:hypothetical protein